MGAGSAEQNKQIIQSALAKDKLRVPIGSGSAANDSGNGGAVSPLDLSEFDTDGEPSPKKGRTEPIDLLNMDVDADNEQRAAEKIRQDFEENERKQEDNKRVEMEDAKRIEGAWEDFLPLLQQDVESVEGKEALKAKKEDFT